MNTKNKKIIVLFGVLALCFIFLPAAAQAGDLKIGAVCTEDGDCATSECEESTKKDASGQNIKYCVCNEDENKHCSLKEFGGYGGEPEDWDCSNGADATYDLNYCIREKNKSANKNDNIKAPIGFTDASFIDAILDPRAATQATVSEIQKILDKPRLSIRIPGLEFGEVKQVEEGGEKYVLVPYLGEYIAAIYRYGIIAAGIVAVVFIINSGIQWITSAGSKERIEGAKKQITRAIIGLIILATSYLLLYTINPELVEFKSLQIVTIKGIPLEDEDLAEEQIDAYNATTVGVAGIGKTMKGFLGPFPPEYKACSKEGAQWAATELEKKGICVGPCHCAWTASLFMRYIGCDVPASGGTFTLSYKLEEKGWATQLVTNENKNNLPIGMLFVPGHTGVSIGNGKDFESAPAKLKKVDSIAGSSCAKKDLADIFTNHSLCSACAKLSGHEPWSGLFTNSGKLNTFLRDNSKSIEEKRAYLKKAGGCQGSQGWGTGKVSTGWKGVVSPPGTFPSNIERGCCVLTSKGVKNRKKFQVYTTQAWCDIFSKGSGPFTKNFISGQTKEQCDPSTVTEYCCVISGKTYGEIEAGSKTKTELNAECKKKKSGSYAVAGKCRAIP